MKAASLNHVYRLVWSKVHSAWVAVAEIATSQGKSSSAVKADVLAQDAVQDATLKVDFKTSAKLALVVTCALQMFNQQAYALDANALPTGAQSVYGNSTISVNGNVMNINQTTQNAVVNWQTFNIGSSAAVNLFQPNAGSALYRVLGNDASQIYGQLNATGQLFLINPNGVLFGQGAQVNVGGLVASTLNMSNADFLNGRYVFNGGNSTASVSNYGTIQAGNEGFVVFLGNTVNNAGTITATNGSVSLAAGQEAVLDFYGNGLVKTKLSGDALNAVINNSGNISATGGAVQLATNARASAINVSGIIEANSLVERNGVIRLEGGDNARVSVSGTLSAQGLAAGTQGGNISVTGEQVALFSGANLDASGQAGGGTVLVGGDLQGKNADVYNARTTYVDGNASIKVDATQQGNGGKAIVWANDIARFYGNISAKGGAVAGNGGFVEVSGKLNVDFLGTVDLSAINGVGGQFLLDPWNIILQSAAAGTTVPTDNASGVGFADIAFDGSTSATPDTKIQISKITGFSEAFFQANNNITVSNGISMAANNTIRLEAKNDINVNANIQTSGTGNIKLSAYNDINLKGTLNTTGTGGITLTADADNSGTGNLAIGASITSRAIDITAATISHTTGNISAKGLTGADSGYINITTTGATNLGSALLVATGGTAAAAGAGKNGGAITIIANGGYTGTGNISASGSEADAASTGLAGGNAGSVSITSKNGITTASITAAGNNGSTTDGAGGNAGNISLKNSVAGDITTNGILTAVTGVASGAGAGGTEAAILVENTAATGTVTVGEINASGNAKGKGGSITVFGLDKVTVTQDKSIYSVGGSGDANGADGGNISITSHGEFNASGATIIGSQGGNATNGKGGNAGSILINAYGGFKASGTTNIGTQGGNATNGAGGNGGSVTIKSEKGIEALDNVVIGSQGGNAATTSGANNAGGNAGAVQILNAEIDPASTSSNPAPVEYNNYQVTGDVKLANVGTKSGDSTGTATANSGSVTIKNENRSGENALIDAITGKATPRGDVTIDKVISTAGGLNGNGGDVKIESTGKVTTTDATSTITTSGGAANDKSAGANGGAVSIKAYDAITVNSVITTSGGSAGTTTISSLKGGNAGNVTIKGEKGITLTPAGTVGDIVANGGNAKSAGGILAGVAGGSGGTVLIENAELDGATGFQLNDGVVTGNITTAGISAKSGDAALINFGPNGAKSTAGSVTVSNRNTSERNKATLLGDVTIGGAIDTTGGVNSDGGNVTINSYGAVTTQDAAGVGSIATSGGDAKNTSIDAHGGNAGKVDITAYKAVSIGAAITANGGNANVDPNSNGLGGNAGAVTIQSETGISFTTDKGTITANGGNGARTYSGGIASAGGKGGVISIENKELADITLGSSPDVTNTVNLNNGVVTGAISTDKITASSGDAAGTARSLAGSVSITNANRTSANALTGTAGAVNINKAITTTGGKNSDGGAVTIASTGTVKTTKDGAITASGGTANAESAGAAGGAVSITAYDVITVNAAITTSGSKAGTTTGASLAGGKAGDVTIKGENGITLTPLTDVGNIFADGGAATAGTGNAAGGAGGKVQILNAELDGATGFQVNDGEVLGNIKTAGISAKSGDAVGTNIGVGGFGGTGSATSTAGSVTVSNKNTTFLNSYTRAGNVTIGGAIDTTGGQNSVGGQVDLYALGTVTTQESAGAGSITTSGGAGNSTVNSSGGKAGNVNITAYEGIGVNAAITASGGKANKNGLGGDAGAVTVKSDKNITFKADKGTITANGGAGNGVISNSPFTESAGGKGGVVVIQVNRLDTLNGFPTFTNNAGSITTAAITARSGDGAGKARSTAGSVTINGWALSDNNTSAYNKTVTIDGLINTQGGANSDGGSVTISAHGLVTTTANGSINTQGGVSNTDTAQVDGLAGAVGGNVTINTARNISLDTSTSINTSGANASLGNGGKAGNVRLEAETGIAMNGSASIVAKGGNAAIPTNNSNQTANYSGGNGGEVTLDNANVNGHNSTVTGDITVGAITTSSGNAVNQGTGQSGTVWIYNQNLASGNNQVTTPQGNITINKAITTTGGKNGTGGAVTIQSTGAITTQTDGTITTSGGLANDNSAGAAGGAVAITAYGAIAIDKAIKTSGSAASDTQATKTAKSGGAAGAVTIKGENGIKFNATNGSITATGGAAKANGNANASGGAGGTVQIINAEIDGTTGQTNINSNKVTGAVETGAITTSSGDSVNPNQGQISYQTLSGTVTVTNANRSGLNVLSAEDAALATNQITIAKAITTTGGKSGSGGAVSIDSTGKVTTAADGSITTTGGEGSDANQAGGAGGAVFIKAYGVIDVNAAIDSSGANANAIKGGGGYRGGAAGAVTILGEKGITFNTSNGNITAKGGDATNPSQYNSQGGDGGSVQIINAEIDTDPNALFKLNDGKVTGEVSTAAITTSSGNGRVQIEVHSTSGTVTITNANRSSANALTVEDAKDANNKVTINKAINTAGGTGGKGGAVTISSTGTVTTTSEASISTSGGAIEAGTAALGASGGAVSITAHDAIKLNAGISTSGSNGMLVSSGAFLGGDAGDVTIRSEKGITLTPTLADITANGGKAVYVVGRIPATKGGKGGTVLIENAELDAPTGFQLNNGKVEGSITTAGISAKSGDAAGTNTSTAGSVTVSNRNTSERNKATLGGDVTIAGAIDTSGGQNSNGGDVNINTYGAIKTQVSTGAGTITTNGGAGNSAVASNAGAAGNVTITAYKAVEIGAAINANGGSATKDGLGGNAGAVTIQSETGITLDPANSSINANGGEGSGTFNYGTPIGSAASKGGQGGVVKIENKELADITLGTAPADVTHTVNLNNGVVTGDITTGPITASSGIAAGTAKSLAGSVTVTNNNVGYLGKGDPLTKLLAGDVTIDGAIDTTGGKNSNGGAVTITTNGKAFTTTKGSITAQGGQANADSNGGAGGGVTITAYDDISLAGTINTSGEDASLGNGGSGGFVTIQSENDITLATTAPITANGGAAATNGNGGANGAVTIRTAQLDGAGADNLNNSLVDGEIKVAAITANVGNGAGTGARGATGLVLISNNDNTTTSTAASANGAKDITLAAAISANGDGEAVRVVSANDVDAGAGSITTSNPAGFYRVYARTPVTFGKGGLTGSYDFVQYATSLGGGILGTGNGLIYKVQPTMTAKLEGTASKSFDGNATAPISGVTKVTGTGGLDGDVLELNNLISATYDNANPGTAKVVTGSYNYATTAEGKPAYNYIYLGGDPIGEIISAPTGSVGIGSLLPPKQEPVNGANLVNVGSTSAGDTDSTGGSSCDTDSLVGSAGGGAVINNGGINTPAGVNVNCSGN